MIRRDPNMGRVEARAVLSPWLEAVATHDCYEAEVRLDALIHTNTEQAQALAKQDEQIAYLGTVYQHALNTIESLRAEIAGLLDGTRPTDNEMRVRRLGRLYHPEGEK